MSVYEIVTNKIISILEEGTVPWRMPWVGGNASPMNLVSKKVYRGINPLLLNFEATRRGFESNSWLSWKQAKSLGGRIKSGEEKKYCMVVFYKILEIKSRDEESKEKTEEVRRIVPLLRYYRVYNLDQIDGMSVQMNRVEGEEIAKDPIEACEQLVLSWKDRPKVRHGEAQAYYLPSKDLVNMPKRKLFRSSEEYYSTLFHELAHSTGHPTRLNRSGIAEFHAFGDPVYSKEEIVAEMAASFLCAKTGIENTTLANSSAYIDSWIRVLKGDSRLVIQAAGQAQRAVEMITE